MSGQEAALVEGVAAGLAPGAAGPRVDVGELAQDAVEMVQALAQVTQTFGRLIAAGGRLELCFSDEPGWPDDVEERFVMEVAHLRAALMFVAERAGLSPADVVDEELRKGRALRGVRPRRRGGEPTVGGMAVALAQQVGFSARSAWVGWRERVAERRAGGAG